MIQAGLEQKKSGKWGKPADADLLLWTGKIRNQRDTLKNALQSVSEPVAS